MPIFTENLPLALYVHIPWCVQKCPYCDFNSHARKDRLPEELYVAALLQELKQHADTLQHRPLVSIFFGGGTPSLFSGKAIADILNGVANYLLLPAQAEITLEANPGTVDQAHFLDFRAAGVNRLSIGMQSLQDDKLKTLGRIHDREHALKAVNIAKQSGFQNFNLDIMYGLPAQSMSDALQDLHDALACEPTHFSWYQLTIEPNTLFYHQRPTLPPDDTIWEMQLAGQDYLQRRGCQQYEVSAYAQTGKQCAHNRNYWEFGDYLGIGAGAHSKITDVASGKVTRFAQVRHPKDYLDAAKRQYPEMKIIAEKDLIFEFMLNALRLTDGVPKTLFTAHTGMPVTSIADILQLAQHKGLLEPSDEFIRPSAFGKKFLNDLVEMFL
jgi:putative oxygen-independent coproporphyrinogen III oxidase